VGLFLSNFFQMLVFALWLLVLGRVIVSWVDPSGRNRISQMLFQATEPLLGPIRRVLPRTGMVDFSPLVLMIVLSVIVRAIAR
jgi:YggT family protein